MLEASCHLGFGKPDYRPYSLDELVAVVDQFAAAPPLSRLGGGVSGAHAWISVIDRGFVLHAYFGEETGRDGSLSFELFGPCPPGTEREHGDAYDGNGLAGEMSVQCLKDTLSLLDQSQSPVEYVRENALSVAVIEDV